MKLASKIKSHIDWVFKILMIISVLFCSLPLGGEEGAHKRTQINTFPCMRTVVRRCMRVTSPPLRSFLYYRLSRTLDCS